MEFFAGIGAGWMNLASLALGLFNPEVVGSNPAPATKKLQPGS